MNFLVIKNTGTPYFYVEGKDGDVLERIERHFRNAKYVAIAVTTSLSKEAALRELGLQDKTREELARMVPRTLVSVPTSEALIAASQKSPGGFDRADIVYLQHACGMVEFVDRNKRDPNRIRVLPTTAHFEDYVSGGGKRLSPDMAKALVNGE